MKFSWSPNTSDERCINPPFQRTHFLLPSFFWRYINSQFRTNKMVSSADCADCASLSFKIILKDKSFHISINSLGLYLSPECHLSLLSNLYIPPCMGKIIKLLFTHYVKSVMEFFLVRIFPHSDCIRRDTEYLVWMRENKPPIWTLFTQSQS